MKYPNFKLEKQKLNEGYTAVIGCDEAGRGCLAGPVVAAAVILNPVAAAKRKGWYKELNDSKKLTAEKRFMLEKILRKEALAFGIGAAHPEVIDRMNIHHANLLAMKRAVTNAHKMFSHGTITTTSFVIVDGKFIVPGIELEQEAVVKADALALSVAAASILAKTYRDRLMMRLSKKYPNYGFEVHKGYATKKHREALATHGLSEIHRKTFCGTYGR